MCVCVCVYVYVCVRMCVFPCDESWKSENSKIRLNIMRVDVEHFSVI